MNRYIKTALLAGAAWSGLTGVAIAQDAPAGQEASQIEDVIVTARRTRARAWNVRA